VCNYNLLTLVSEHLTHQQEFNRFFRLLGSCVFEATSNNSLLCFYCAFLSTGILVPSIACVLSNKKISILIFMSFNLCIIFLIPDSLCSLNLCVFFKLKCLIKTSCCLWLTALLTAHSLILNNIYTCNTLIKRHFHCCS
jgi:hypothetical protein